jgi:outer membrane protein TolC
MSRYLKGLTDYLTALVALGRMQLAERELVAARQQLLLLRVQLHRALGGEWMSELERPDRGGNDVLRGSDDG